jgi:diaminohydroxyphosphoribosylaminopyrimidine deaminase/5-amino-6-(5-phosphoribosylamino)uracil reductase
MNDERYMRLALNLALKGEGFVEPNPLVGAVIVRNNKIIGKGYHQYFGGPHAEINAINSVKNPEQLKGATLYLTLEPCVHFGKTPPCAPAIVQSGIKKVVIATRDPNRLANLPTVALAKVTTAPRLRRAGGKGIRFLKQHGITVTEGILAEQAKNINKPFFKLHKKGLPYVVAKWAMSLDGKLATGTPARPFGRSGGSDSNYVLRSAPHSTRWITSEKSRNYARGIRAKMNGVMVGIGTVLKDNPTLLPQINTSHRLHRLNSMLPINPVRIILDSRARIPVNSNLIKTINKGNVYLMVSSLAPAKNVRLLEQKGVLVFRVPSRKGRLDFMAVLKTLAKNGVNKIMIEGGGEVLGSAFDHKAVDEVYAFIAPKIIGGRDAKKPVEGNGINKVKDALQLKDVSIKYLNPDILIHGYT